MAFGVAELRLTEQAGLLRWAVAGSSRRSKAETENISDFFGLEVMSSSEADCGECIIVGLERECEGGGGESTSSSTELELERDRERDLEWEWMERIPQLLSSSKSIWDEVRERLLERERSRLW